MNENGRYQSLDALRGFIIVVMALDHANGFIARSKLEPELWYFLFPDYGGDAVSFVTRLVTHLAAPGFFFLMGAGMMLFTLSRQQKGWSTGRILRHFVLRGGMLILFQFLLENPAWDIGTDLNAFDYFGVLYALGGGMIIGSLFLLLPSTAVLLTSLLLIVGTEWLLPAQPDGFATFSVAQLLFTTPGFGEIWVPQTLVLYPILPWLGVTGLGVVYGRMLQNNPEQTYRYTLWISLLALLAFVPIRLFGSYGNIRPMATTDWIGILNGVKYPPSLTFLLLTLGVNGLVLRLFVWLKERATFVLRPFVILGQEPLFFYVTHLYLYGYMGLWLNQNGSLTIPQMLPYWLLGVAILLPCCWGYGRVKRRLKSA